MWKIALAAAFVACAPVAAPAKAQINRSKQLSSDPLLVSVVSTFLSSCIQSAPVFAVDQMRARFADSTPALPSGMAFVATGKPGKSCKVSVRNYGSARPMPTLGDLNWLAQQLQARVGDKIKYKQNTKAGSAKVQAGRDRFNLYAFVGRKGDLSFSVSR